MTTETSTQERLRKDYDSSIKPEPDSEIVNSEEMERNKLNNASENTDFDDIADEEIVKRDVLKAGIDPKREENAPNGYPLCKHCCFHTIFKHDGEDPIFKKGIWVKTGNGICTRHHSLDMQNNRGIWYICDTKTAKSCHLYEAR